MIFMSQFQFDFSKFKSAEIRVKNNIYLFLFFIFVLTPLILIITGAILYFLEAPIQSNDTYYPIGSPEYNSFYRIYFLITFFLILLSCIPLVIPMINKEMESIYISDNSYLDPFIYVKTKKMNLYITDTFLITHHLKSDRITKESNLEMIFEAKAKYLFWFEEERASKVKTKRQSHKLIISYSMMDRHINLRKRYLLYLDGTDQVIKYREMISTYYRGNSNVRSLKEYYVVSYNSASIVTIDPFIQKELNLIQ